MRKDSALKSGEVFGRLTIIERDYDKELERKKQGRPDVPYYICKCSCGNIITVSAHSLCYGNTKSCGCFHKERAKETKHHKDLSGFIFRELVVVEKDNSSLGGSGKHTYWICRCSLCGLTKSYRSSDLLSGKSSCDCQIKKRISESRTIDLTGRKFGHLFVLGRDKSKGIKSGQHAHWICKCDICGRTESVHSGMILREGKDRCKYCGKCSLGEAKIIDLLEQAKIQYIHDMPYSDCIYPRSGGKLRFDFCVSTGNTYNPIYMIEYDGEQHYRQAPGWDKSDNDVIERQMRDKFKNKWCEEHGIPMVRIPYTRMKELNIDDLKLETTDYRVV